MPVLFVTYDGMVPLLINTFSTFAADAVHAIEIQVKQHADVKHVSATLLQVYLALV